MVNPSYVHCNVGKAKPIWKGDCFCLGAALLPVFFSVLEVYLRNFYCPRESRSGVKVDLDTLQEETKAMDKLLLIFVAWSQEQKIISCHFCMNRALLRLYLHHLISHSCFKEKEWTLLGVGSVCH